jgi:tetratricopeptide (TPR) repeat protein
MKRIFTLKSVLFHGLSSIFLLQSCGISEKKTSSLASGRQALSEKYCSPELVDKLWYTSTKKAPLFRGLDGIHFNITTKSAEAQQYFNQGMMLAYGFNHAEAARSFHEASRLDSTSAMCLWGFAYVLGPNYNFGMEPDNLQRAYNAVYKAEKLSSGCTQKEKSLIHALSYRYSNDPNVKRSSLDSAFASQMRLVYKKYPKDVDIAALFAESLMDLHPWDLFKPDGTAQPWTPEILTVLEQGLKMDARHPGINHYYIHAVEMSHTPEKGMASAELLCNLIPGAGHLVHMPSHIFIRTGKYHDGVVANLKAVLVDSSYVEACHANGSYPLALFPHNYHFLAACATLDGESRNAIIGATHTKALAHNKLLFDPYWASLQHFYSIPFFVHVTLGKWDEIQNMPEPEKELTYPRVIWHYAQGMALLAHHKTSKAEKQLQAMMSLMQDTTLKKLTIFGANSVYDICQIASETLDGEIRAKKGDYPAAVKLLRSALVVEDNLKYQEPPDWFFSVRHNLGAVLIESGNYQEAIKVYKEDLEHFPENGWALAGLMNACQKLGDQADYQEFKNRFEQAWKYADISIASSRIL